MKNFIIIVILLAAGIMTSAFIFYPGTMMMTPEIFILISMIILESIVLIYFYRKLKN